MSKPIAIVAAMRRELAPLLRGLRPRTVDDAKLFELTSALVVIGGIGRGAGQRAAEIAIREANPAMLVSAGFCGALTPDLAAGEVVFAGRVIDGDERQSYETEQTGPVMVSSVSVAATGEKEQLRQTFGAAIVDMEGAIVARAAKQHGLRFVAVKAVSDELTLPMPPLNRFVDGQGKFRVAPFAMFVAVRPQWWKPVRKMARNSKLAAKNLSFAVQHLMEQCSRNTQEERASLA